MTEVAGASPERRRERERERERERGIGDFMVYPAKYIAGKQAIVLLPKSQDIVTVQSHKVKKDVTGCRDVLGTS
jgi:hypothetical protein